MVATACSLARLIMPETLHKVVTIANRLGLHARAAAKFVNVASHYEADIRLKRDSREVNAKSIMGVMMLAASQGTTVEIQATGDDATEAISALESLVDEKFGEEE